MVSATDVSYFRTKLLDRRKALLRGEGVQEDVYASEKEGAPMAPPEEFVSEDTKE